MKFYEYNKHVNAQVKVFGMAFKDLLIVTGGLTLLILIGAFFNIIIQIVPGWYYLFLFGIYFASIIVLRRANKNDHPSFLVSVISFRLLQAKYILFFYPRIKNKNESGKSILRS